MGFYIYSESTEGFCQINKNFLEDKEVKNMHRLIKYFIKQLAVRSIRAAFDCQVTIKLL